MTPKQRLQSLVNDLPDNASTAFAARETMELAKYLESLDDFEHDRTVDHEDVMAEFEALADRIETSADRITAFLKRFPNSGADVPLARLVAELLQSASDNLTAEQLIYEIELLDRRGVPADEEADDDLFDEDSDDAGSAFPPVVVESPLGLPRVDRPH